MKMICEKIYTTAKRRIFPALFLIIFLATFAFSESVYVTAKGGENEALAKAVAEKAFAKKGYTIAASEGEADLVADLNLTMGGANACVFALTASFLSLPMNLLTGNPVFCTQRDSGWAEAALDVKDKSGSSVFQTTAKSSSKENTVGLWIPFVDALWIPYLALSKASSTRANAMAGAISKAVKDFNK